MAVRPQVWCTRGVGIDGVLVVNKPTGPTSHDVVAVARRALGLRRIGHTGTLDPQASGVLPLVVGRATRLARFLSGADKEYAAEICFGVETDTYDRAGQIVRETGETPSRERLLDALGRFRGPLQQMPPAFSAKKVEGRRAYTHARNARPVALAAVPVVVRALELVAFEPPRATLHITCSAGFYVRSLAHDLGQALGTGACLEALVRRRAGAFALGDALPLDEIAAGVRDRVLPRLVPLDQLLPELPAVWLTTEGAQRAAHGQRLGVADWRGEHLEGVTRVRLVTGDGHLIGIAEAAKTPGFLQPLVIFG